jgi:type I restriction enzyme S subunit
MSSEWREFLLDEIAELNGGYAFKSEEYTKDGHFVLRTVNISEDGRISRDGATYVSQESAKKYERFLLKNLDTLFVMVGATLGKTGLVKENDLPALLNQNMWVVRARNDRVDPLFLHYAFKILSRPLSSQASGSARGFVKRDDFRKMKICAPEIGTQREISGLLGALDDRINLLRETNKTLEAIAQALFKSWFVDFDPVRAKMEGSQPEGMDEATAALFPDSFEESEMGEIPQGWTCRSLDQIATYLNGLALQKFPASGVDDLPVIKIAQLRKGDTIGADLASRTMKKEYIIQDGDVLFSWSGSLEVEIWCGGEGALNQHLFKVTSEKFPKWFYFLWTRHHLAHFRQVAASKATTMGHIQRSHLSEAKALVPPQRLIDALGSVMAPIFERIVGNALQVQALSNLRDTLLPRLISGQLRLPEAEAQIGAHTA